jgi:WD40 repeat protein
MKKLISTILLVACIGLQASKITLESNDGKRFTLEKEIAEKSITIKNLLEDNPSELETFEKNPIPLPTIQGEILKAIVNCLQNPEGSEAIEDIIKSLSGEQLKAFTMAVQYLDIQYIYKQLPAVKWLNEILGTVWTEKTLVSSPDRKSTKTGHWDSQAQIQDGVTNIAISPDNNFIVIRYVNTAQIWNKDGTLRASLNHPKRCISVAISPDSNFIVTGASDGTARIWNKDGTLRASLQHNGSAVLVAVSPDGSFILTVDIFNGKAYIWDTSGTQKAVLQGDPTWKFLTLVSISPDSKYIVARYNHALYIWDTQGTPQAILPGAQQDTTKIAFSPDNNFIAALSFYGIQIYDKNFRELKYLQWNENTGPFPIVEPEVAISPNNNFIVTMSSDGTMRVWNIVNDTLTVLSGSQYKIIKIAISPDSNFIVTGSLDGTARIWNKDGKVLTVLQGHRAKITSIAISSDSNFIVTGSLDGTARIWNKNGKVLTVLQGHQDEITNIAISPDGNFIVTGSLNGPARIWFATNRELVNDLTVEQINLITDIYEKIQNKQPLSLDQDANLILGTLPPNIQTALSIWLLP